METRPFFGPLGDSFEASDKTELLNVLSHIDRNVPAKRKKRDAAGRLRKERVRTTNDRERYCLVDYLIALADNDILQFPLEVTKGESPDFFITSKKTVLGVELSDATSTDWQRELAETEDDPEPELDGDGWVGKLPERQWVSEVFEAVEKKTRILNKPHYKLSQNNCLLIHDEIQTSLYIHNSEIKSLVSSFLSDYKDFMGDNPGLRFFDQISILRGAALYYDVIGQNLILRVSC